MTAAVRYRILPKHPGAHLFEVMCTIVKPDPDGQMVSLPTWIPGSYLIREFARNIVWLSASCDNKSVAAEKADKATWRCAPCSGPLTLVYEIHAWDLSVRAAHLDETHGFFNGSSVFLMVHGQENEPVEVEILPPEGQDYSDWRVATALPRAGAEPYGFGTYRADNYDELIDHPVEMGAFTLATFDACGVPHDIAVTGRHRADMKQMTEDFKKICEYQIRLFGEREPDSAGESRGREGEAARGTSASQASLAGAIARAPMDRYVFLVMALGEGYGGLEHRASAALVCSRDDLPLAHEKERGEKYRGFLGLASHEYFHTWNVKRIKPVAFLPYDLSRENYTRQLWAFEGITSYYDDLVLVRSGLISREQYLSLIGETITRVLRGSGRLKQSIAESSFDAWIKYYRLDENAPNAVVNYYAKGSLVGLALDLTIRLETDNRQSLDDVMRALWLRHGSKGIGVPEGGIEQVAAEIAGTSLDDFFALAVHGTEDIPLKELLAEFGVEYLLRAAESAADSGGKPASRKPASPRAVLGAKVSSNGEARLVHVYDGGAAQAAGLSAGDVVMAIDGIKAGGGNLDARIASYPVGVLVRLHAFRRDELMEFSVTVQAAPEDTCHLALTETVADAINLRRESWLAGEDLA